MNIISYPVQKTRGSTITRKRFQVLSLILKYLSMNVKNIFNVLTKKVLSQKTGETILRVEETGQERYESFVICTEKLEG